MGDEFEATVRTVGEALVLSLRGNVDREAGAAVDDAYENIVPGQQLVLDFTETDYVNSSGIALIVSVLARARAEGRRVAAYGLSEHYREIFEITRLSDFIEICTDLSTAVTQPA